MKLRRAAFRKISSGSCPAKGTEILADAIRSRYQTERVASPCPAVSTIPSSPSLATEASLLVYLPQRVTSSVRPSEKKARTTSRCLSPGRSIACEGWTSNRSIMGSSGVGPLAPPAIQSARIR